MSQNPVAIHLATTSEPPVWTTTGMSDTCSRNRRMASGSTHCVIEPTAPIRSMPVPRRRIELALSFSDSRPMKARSTSA